MLLKVTGSVNKEGLTEFGWVVHITTSPPTLSHPVSLISSDAPLLHRADRWAAAVTLCTAGQVWQGYRRWTCHFGSSVSGRERDGAADPPRGSPPHHLQPGLSQNVPAAVAAAAAGPQCGIWMELNRFTAASRHPVTAASKPETVCRRFENKSS